MRNFLISIRMLIVFTFITGIIYPGAVTFLAQGLFPFQANGSLLMAKNGEAVGSLLIAQKFSGDSYFWPRPSAIDYNPQPSGGSQLGPSSSALKEQVDQRRKQGLQWDSLFTSASGLDPHISMTSALTQIDRVAKARKMDGSQKQILLETVQAVREQRQFGFIGEERVNVLVLNRRLDGAP